MNYKERCIFLKERIKRLNAIGLALTTENDTNKIFEMILEESRHITNADGRTLYMINDDGNLKFEIMITDSLKIHNGGTSGNEIPPFIKPIPLIKEDGEENHSHISAHVALTGEICNIKDAYDEEGFDFSGTKAFDKNTGFRTTSVLNVPLKNHEDDIIGVIQLINARDVKTNGTSKFFRYKTNL